MNKKLLKFFREYNKIHWNNQLPEINLILTSTFEPDTVGEYISPDSEEKDVYENYCIKIAKGLNTLETKLTLLHEMVHHSQFTKNKQKYFKKKLKWHGTFWRQEMRRVGFKGKINQYT